MKIKTADQITIEEAIYIVESNLFIKKYQEQIGKIVHIKIPKYKSRNTDINEQ